MTNDNGASLPWGTKLPAIDFAVYSSYLSYQTPLMTGFIAAMHGVDLRPLAGKFTYAQVGPGEPAALAALADAYPNATFLAVMEEPATVARGKRMAETTGLANLEFREGGLEEAVLPDCDMIVLASLYSAHGPDERAKLVAMLSRRLKAGGLLCMQYSALPGAAATDAVYQLLRELAANLDGDLPTRFRGAVQRAVELVRGGALVFKQFPAAVEILEQMTKSDLSLGAREALNTRTHALYASEVMAELQAVGLEFAGSGQFVVNLPELSLPPPLRGTLDGLKAPAARELFLDYARNAQARVDIYAKPGPRGAREPAELLGEYWLFRLIQGPETLRRQQLAQNTGVDFTAGLYTDLLEAVSARPRRIDEILEDTAMRRHARGRALKAIQLLIGADMLALALQPEPQRDGPLPEIVTLSSKFNESMLHDNLDNPEIVPFSSPFTGQRLVLNLAQRIQLHLLLGGDIDTVIKGLAARGFELQDKDGKVLSKEAFKSSLLAEREKFRSQDAVYLRAAGLIASA